LLIFECI
jgi:hypothetical protein